MHSGSRVLATRIKAANAPAFAPADMKAVTEVGAPSYTSGVQEWNGTMAALNPRPTIKSAKPATV